VGDDRGGGGDGALEGLIRGCVCAAPPQPGGHRVTGFTGVDHRARRPAVKAGAVAGVAAAVASVGVGTAMLLHAPSTTRSAGPTAERITVSTQSATVPLSAPQILGLTGRRPDLGVFTDASRRASCLTGLGYLASTKVLGGQPVDINGRAAVLLVLPGSKPQELAALVVPLNCNSADTGLIADTQIPRP
jgi:hypothetical protein